jgi:hypothetical protein
MIADLGLKWSLRVLGPGQSGYSSAARRSIDVIAGSIPGSDAARGMDRTATDIPPEHFTVANRGVNQ